MTAEASAVLEKIFAAAEPLFARHGYNGTTLRPITQRAGVNLAAAHYHHGNKESLYLEILRRRIAPINAIRLQRLTAAESEAGENRVPLETLFDIMAGPLFDLFGASDGSGAQG